MIGSSTHVLVTGGGGFLGSHVVEELHARRVTNVSVPRSWNFDLRYAQDCASMLDRYDPDLVIHLAASVGGIGANQANPGQYFYENMAMGLNLLEAARERRVPKVLVAGTVCAYPKFTPVPFKESSLWDGFPEETNAPYGVAKKALLTMCQAYRQQYGSNFIMVFPTNLYGPRDNFDLDTSHVIPAMIRKFVEATRMQAPLVTLWGDGSPTREFLYVEDAARGICDAANLYDKPAPVNLGSGDEISILDLAAMISAEIGYRGKIEWDTKRPNGQPRRCLDTTLAKKEFGFEAKVGLTDGIARTIKYYLRDAMK